MFEIDYDKLKKDLIDYFGTALFTNPFAMSDIVKVESASLEELVEIARKNGFDLDKYNKKKIYYK